MKRKSRTSQAEALLAARVFPPQIRKGDRTKLKIVQSALKSLSQEGADALTFQSVGAHMGFEGPQVKYHFPNKEDLIFRAVELMLLTAQEIFILKIEKAATPLAKIKAIVEGLFEWAATHPEQRSAYLYFFYRASFDPRYKNLYNEMLTTGFARMGALVDLHFLNQKRKVKNRDQLGQSLWAQTLGLLIYEITSTLNSGRGDFKSAALKNVDQLLKSADPSK